jgi:hypothetical protein
MDSLGLRQAARQTDSLQGRWADGELTFRFGRTSRSKAHDETLPTDRRTSEIEVPSAPQKEIPLTE